MRVALALCLLIFLLYAFSRHETRDTVKRSTGEAVNAATPLSNIVPAPARVIAARFEANEVAAEQDYKGKVGAVFGTVTDIGVDVFGAPFLVLDGEEKPYGVQCSFDRNYKAIIATMHKGGSVAVQGTFGGKMFHVQMSDCVLQH